MSISLIQSYIKEEGLDGWLLYDFHACNDLMWQTLGIPDDTHITRRMFYFFPKEGTPKKFVHAIESHVLDCAEGDVITYKTRDELKEVLSKYVRGEVAMEVSEEIPTISKVDAGTYKMIRDLGIKVVSSGKILQKCTSVLSKNQIKSHLDAADVVSKAVDDAVSFMRGELLQEKLLYEKDVQEFILNRFTDEGCITDHPPIVAKGENSANPHYMSQGRGSLIKEDDFVLIDLWCKKRDDNAVFADITRVVALGDPTAKMKKAFEAVREAQKLAVHHIEEKGGGRACDVDQAVRGYLEKMGYKENILHRLGHNISTQLHGNGANFDSFETMDERELIDRTCYSIEPALYFPGEFGLRLEHDILFDKGKIQVTGGVQDDIAYGFVT